MNSSNDNLQAFTTSVQNTLSVLRRLEAALETEQSALTGQDAEQLEQAVRAKLTVLADLEPLLSQRDAIQQQLGVPAGPAGGDQLIGNVPEMSVLRKDWDELKLRADKVEKLNTRNGQLALHGEKTARHAVALLTGRPAEPATYGRRGRNHHALGGTTLSKV